MDKKILISVFIVLIVVGVFIFVGVKKVQGTTKTLTNTISKENGNKVENNEKVNEEENSMYSSGIHHATIEIKGYGKIKLELDANNSPITVANFAKLVNEGFYDGLTFHRIIDGFMMQGGDPLGNGTGGSSETIKGEFKLNGVKNRISHVRGVISMARSNNPNSASSQFFIVHQDSSHLDGQYAAFGKVFAGFDTLDKIATVKTDGNDRPLTEQKIKSIKFITVEKA